LCAKRQPQRVASVLRLVFDTAALQSRCASSSPRRVLSTTPTAPFKEQETGTRWTLPGRAVDGPLKGQETPMGAEHPMSLVRLGGGISGHGGYRPSEK